VYKRALDQLMASTLPPSAGRNLPYCILFCASWIVLTLYREQRDDAFDGRSKLSDDLKLCTPD